VTLSGAHDRRKTDAAGTEDRDDAAGLDAGAGHDRSVARHDGAAHERRDVERRVGADGDAAALRDDAALGEGREVRVVVEGIAVLGEPQRPARKRAPEHVLHRDVAENLAPAGAVEAAPAGGQPGEDHVVALGDRVHTLAHGGDDPGALVPEHGRQGVRGGAGDDVPVAVADAARGELHLDLARAGLSELDLLDGHGLIEPSEHGGAHVLILSRWPRYARAVKTQAAVLWEPGRPIEILDVDLAPPRDGEVLVKIAACGVCASDLHVVDGDLPEPLPLVLGHEAAGVVVETGPGVESLSPGDHVVLALVPSCGECSECRRGRPNFCEVGARMAAMGALADGTSRLSLNGTVLRHFNSISSFAEHAVVPESAAVRIRDDVPLETVALIGCSVLTGCGAVLNTAAV